MDALERSTNVVDAIPAPLPPSIRFAFAGELIALLIPRLEAAVQSEPASPHPPSPRHDEHGMLRPDAYEELVAIVRSFRPLPAWHTAPEARPRRQPRRSRLGGRDPPDDDPALPTDLTPLRLSSPASHSGAPR